MLNRRGFFIEVAYLVMPVLSKPAALMGNPAAPIPRGTPISLIIRIILSDHGIIYVCVQYAIICFAIQLKLPWYSFIVELLLDEIVKKFDFLLWDDDFCSRMSVWLETDSPTGEMIVLKIRSMLENDLNKKDPNNNHNYLFGAVFDYAPDSGHYFLDTNPKHFDDYFGFVCDCMFPEKNVQELQSQIFKSRKILKKLCDGISNVVEVNSYTPPPEAPHSLGAIVTRTAITFSPESQPFVPTPMVPDNTPVNDFHEPTVSLPVQLENNTTELVSAVVNKLLEEAIVNVIIESAEAIGARNQAALSHILGKDHDANALRDEVARKATIDESTAFMEASAALKVTGLVNSAAKGGKSVFQDHPHQILLARSVDPVIQPYSPVTIEYVPVEPTDYFPLTSSNVTHGDANSAYLFAATSSPIPPLPDQHLTAPWFCANGAGGPLSVIPERTEDGADQSGKSSPSQLVKDELLLLLPLSLLRSNALKTEPSELNTILHGAILQASPPSGQNGTFLTHDCEKSSPKSSFTPADSKPIVHSSEWTGIGVGGAQLPGNPIGNPPGIVLSTVDVSRNPHADQPSFPPKSDVGGPPVQVLAKSGKPPSGDSDGADHLETPSSSKLWSSCIPGRKTGSSTPRQNPQPSGWRRIFQKSKSNRVNPNPGQTNDARPQVAHSPGKIPSGSAATTTTLLPSSISPKGGNIGGNPGAHSPGDPHGFVPLPAPSSSSELGSAAAAALSPQSCPSGHEIGGIERNWVRSQFVEFASLVLLMKYATAQLPPPSLMSHPCVPSVPNLVRQARVA